jgi:RND family efflux transporter MFP subunit
MNRHAFNKTLNLLLIASTLLTLISCSSTASPDQEQATPTPVPTAIVPTKPTYNVQRGEVIEEIQFSGRVAPVIQESLFFRTSGRVRNVYVEEGDTVTAGQVIADLEFLDDLERQLATDQLSLRRAEIYVENAQIALDLFVLNKPTPEMVQAEAAWALAEAQDAVTRAQRAFGITQATANQSSIDAAYAQMLMAEQALERAKTNFEPFANKPETNLTRARLQAALSAAQQNYDDAVRQYNAFTGGVSESAQDLASAELLVAQAQLADAQAEWERVQANPIPAGYDEELRLKQNELELAQISYEETKVRVADIEDTIAAAQIIAPIDGVISKLLLGIGRSVEEFKEYVIVSDMTSLEVSASLTSEEMASLEEGMVVSAELLSRPGDTYTGIIRRLPYGTAATEEEDTTTRISLDVNPEEAGLEEGDLMRVTVVLEKKESVLWLPPQAIRTFEGRKFVVVQEEGYQQRVDVKIGIEGEDRTEILEGLQEGQIVVAP